MVGGGGLGAGGGPGAIWSNNLRPVRTPPMQSPPSRTGGQSGGGGNLGSSLKELEGWGALVKSPQKVQLLPALLHDRALGSCSLEVPHRCSTGTRLPHTPAPCSRLAPCNWKHSWAAERGARLVQSFSTRPRRAGLGLNPSSVAGVHTGLPIIDV